MTEKPVRVGFDLTAIWRRPTGIFRYAAEVAKHLLLLQKADASVHYVLFFAHEIHPDFVPYQNLFEAVICPTTNELLIKQFWFPLVLPRLRLDVMHYPSFPPPYFQPFGPHTVMTLHDAGPWRYASTLTVHGRLYFRTLLTRGMHTSTQVITVSKHAKSEIGYFLGKRFLSKVAVIPEAARPEFAIHVDESFKERTRQKYQLTDHYLLTVATVEPRKNLVTLLAAYRLLKQQLDTCCPPLVIVGRKGWNCDDILGYMKELDKTVLFPGHVSDEELIALYQLATGFVFPSLYEGFGLPVLEAMTAGCPVITSKVSSLPEVAGDAALLVDPLDAEALAAAMRQLLENKDLQASLSRAGEARAASFSWEETARRSYEVYLLAAKRSHSR